MFASLFTQKLIHDDESSMPGIVFPALNNILRLISKKNNDLREECVRITDILKKQDAEYTKASEIDTEADKYFLAFKLACEVNKPKVRAIALDAMHKLMSYRYFIGDAPADPALYPSPHRAGRKEPVQPSPQHPEAEAVPANGSVSSETELKASPDTAPTTTAPTSSVTDSATTAIAAPAPSSVSRRARPRLLLDAFVEVLYDCSVFDDDAVQLGVLQCLLTALTSANCLVHDHSLLLALRACYHIFLMAHSPVTRSTARATLTQLTNLTFHRAETAISPVNLSGVADGEASDGTHASFHTSTLEHILSVAVAEGEGAISPRSAQDAVAESSPDAMDSTESPEGEKKEESADNGEDTSTPTDADATPSPSVDTPDAGTDASTPEVEDDTAVVDVDGKQVAVDRHAPVSQSEATTAVDLVTSAVSPSSSTASAAAVASPRPGRSLLLQLDAYQVLRALCKLAAKPLGDPPEPAALRSKSLTLELLLSILQSPGTVLARLPPFVALVRDELLPALCSCLTAPAEDVCHMAASLLVAVVRHYRRFLKLELGVFISRVVCELPGHPNATFAHKMAALDVLVSLARDPVLLVELFLNYDARGQDVFRDVTAALERSSRASFASEGWVSAQEEQQLRVLALEGLVSLLRSLVSWATDVLQGKPLPKSVNVIGDGDSEEDAAAEDGMDPEDLRALRGLATVSSANPLDKEDGLIAPLHPVVEERERACVLAANNALELLSRSGVDWEEALRRRQQLREASARREALEAAALRFNTDYKKGFQQILAAGIVPKEANAVARLLHDCQLLDKKAVGEMLGGSDPFCKEVLAAYMDSVDFRDMHFDDAIRKLMYMFRLPGEAQMIDRILSTFAEKYFKDNEHNTFFSCASTVYVLAFSVMMLNTDAHSAQVARKMSKEAFLHNNRGIDDGKDIDAGYLSALYDRIVADEIKMRDQERKVASSLPPRRRLALFVREGHELARNAQEMVSARCAYLQHMRARELQNKEHDEHAVAAPAGEDAVQTDGDVIRAGSAQSLSWLAARFRMPAASVARQQLTVRECVWVRASREDVECVAAMFSLMWPSACATFSLLLEEHDLPRVTALCLDGYRYAVRVACMFHLHTARTALLNSLSRFTLLGTTQTMRGKNVDAIRALLRLAHSEGHALGASWGEVLTCMSEFERLHLIARGGTTPTELLGSNASRSHAGSVSGGSGAGTLTPGSPTPAPTSGNVPVAAAAARVLGKSTADAHNDEDKAGHHNAVERVPVALVERVFTQTPLLCPEALVAFTSQLLATSEFELFAQSTPRLHLLQKLLEVCCYNLSRDRSVWLQLWEALSAYFARAGTHPVPTVALAAVDVLRQLVLQFLSDDARARFALQPLMLRPLSVVLSHQQAPTVREFAVQCLSQFVQLRHKTLLAGWRGLFTALAAVPRHGSAASAALVPAAFELLESVLASRFVEATAAPHNALAECVNALCAYARVQGHEDVNLLAIDHLGRCAQFLAAATTKLVDGELDDRCSANGDETHAAEEGKCDDAREDQEDLDSGGVDSLCDAQSLLRAFLPDSYHAARDPNILVYPSTMTIPSSASATSATAASTATTATATTTTTVPAVEVPAVLDTLAALPSSASPSPSPLWTLARDGTRKVWFLVLTGLAQAVTDPRVSIRTHALKTLSKALELHGALFSPQEWAVLLKGVLFPIFDDAVHAYNDIHQHDTSSTTSATASTSTAYNATSFINLRAHIPASHAHVGLVPGSAEAQWVQTTCFPALRALIELFRTHTQRLLPSLPALLELLTACIAQPSEELARVGVKAWTLLVHSLGPHLTPAHWTTILAALHETFRRCLPMDLVAVRTRKLLELPVPMPGAPAWAEMDRDAQLQAMLTLPVIDGVSVDTFTALADQVERATLLADASFPRYSIPTEEEDRAEEERVERERENREDTRAAEDETTVEAAADADQDSTASTSALPSPTASATSNASTSATTASTTSTAASTSADPAAALADRVVFSPGRVVAQCKVQLWLIDALADLFLTRFPHTHTADTAIPTQPPAHTPASSPIVNADTAAAAVPFALGDAHLLMALDTVLMSVDVARRFNQDKQLRTRLWQAGFLRDRQAFAPELYFHENHALKLYASLLARRRAAPVKTENIVPVPEYLHTALSDADMYESVVAATAAAEPTEKQMRATCDARLRHLFAHVFPLYAFASKHKMEDVRRCMDVVVCSILDGLLRLADHPERVGRLLCQFHADIAALVECGSATVRALVSKLLLHRNIAQLITGVFRDVSEGEKDV